MTTITNQAKNAISLTNPSKGIEKTWDNSDPQTWDSKPEDTWDTQTPNIANQAKNTITLNNQSL